MIFKFYFLTKLYIYIYEKIEFKYKSFKALDTQLGPQLLCPLFALLFLHKSQNLSFDI
jgi:hypothetical protein